MLTGVFLGGNPFVTVTDCKIFAPNRKSVCQVAVVGGDYNLIQTSVQILLQIIHPPLSPFIIPYDRYTVILKG